MKHKTERSLFTKQTWSRTEGDNTFEILQSNTYIYRISLMNRTVSSKTKFPSGPLTSRNKIEWPCVDISILYLPLKLPLTYD